MARRVFFSFHFDQDFWRTQQVRNMGALEGQTLCTPNDWEEVKRKGDASVEKWIDANMKGTSCVVVLVGSKTADRKWVMYEIEKGWTEGKGVLAIQIDQLLDNKSMSSPAGNNPFSKFTVGNNSLADIAPFKKPTGSDSKAVYASIEKNIEAWIEEAIRIRKNN